MMNTVAPVWDGNETWMVLGVLACMQPSRWSILRFYLRLYLPIIFMVIALIFRGVAFEFRFKAHRTKHLWDLALFGVQF